MIYINGCSCFFFFLLFVLSGWALRVCPCAKRGHCGRETQQDDPLKLPDISPWIFSIFTSREKVLKRGTTLCALLPSPDRNLLLILSGSIVKHTGRERAEGGKCIQVSFLSLSHIYICKLHGIRCTGHSERRSRENIDTKKTTGSLDPDHWVLRSNDARTRRKGITDSVCVCARLFVCFFFLSFSLFGIPRRASGFLYRKRERERGPYQISTPAPLAPAAPQTINDRWESIYYIKCEAYCWASGWLNFLCSPALSTHLIDLYRMILAGQKERKKK